MDKNVYIDPLKKKVYLIDPAKINIQLFQNILEQTGMETVHIDDMQSALEILHDENHPSGNKPTTTPESHIIDKNIKSTDLLHSLRDLQAAMHWMLFILNHRNVGFVIFDQSRYLMYNKAFSDILHYNREEIGSLRIGDVVSFRQRKQIRKMARQVVVNRQSILGCEMDLFTGDKRFIHILGHAFHLQLNDSGIGVAYILDEELQGYSGRWERDMEEQMILEFHSNFENLVQNLSINHPIEQQPTDNQQPVSRPNKANKPFNLTKRELEVLQHICKGYSNHDIADKLCISVRTVEFHRSNLHDKTHTRNVAGLVRLAIQNQLVEL